MEDFCTISELVSLLYMKIYIKLNRAIRIIGVCCVYGLRLKRHFHWDYDAFAVIR